MSGSGGSHFLIDWRSIGKPERLTKSSNTRISLAAFFFIITTAIARKTGRTKAFYAREAILMYREEPTLSPGDR